MKGFSFITTCCSFLLVCFLFTANDMARLHIRHMVGGRALCEELAGTD